MIATEADFQWIVERIVALHNPNKIFLFGSHALATANDQSDIDLLIVAPSRLPRLHRGKDVVAVLTRFPCRFELLFYTPQELEEQLRDPYSFEARILAYARLLYSRSG